MKNSLKVIYLISFIIICFSKISFAQRNDYSFEISPLIEKNRMFSVGLGGTFIEHNSWFNNGVLYILDPYNQNTSRRNIYFTFAPYFKIRPMKCIELDISARFIYQRQDSRNDLTSATNFSHSFGFNTINASIKATFLDWYLSIGAKIGIGNTFNDNFSYQELNDPLNMYATIMIAGIPKVIPVNFLFTYTFDSRNDIIQNIFKYGEIVGAIEIITSPFVTLYTGITYLFPYKKENELTYIEAFIKFKATISDFLYMTASYHKVVWGNGNVANSSTFNFSIEYMFYTPKWDWWNSKFNKK